MSQNQLDLFVCEAMDFSFKDDLLSMETPLFSLNSGKKPDTTIKTYEKNGETFEIIPSAAGHATIFDKDVLLYAISFVMEAVNRGEKVSKTLRITIHNFLETTQRSIGGAGYQRVENALTRLKGTQIKSTLFEKVVAEHKGVTAVTDIKRIQSVGLETV